MDNKTKLNARCNWWLAVSRFWTGLSKPFGKINRFMINQSMYAMQNVYGVIGEMLNEDYPEDYKEDLKDILNIKIEL